MPFFEYPGRVTAALAFAVRLGVGWAALVSNPLLRNLNLDSEYYVRWGREIAAGDVASLRGIVADSPFVLNPLYAYVIAPVVGTSADAPRSVLLLQAALGAATAALTAVAARRLFGRTAAWTAGLAVAFSTALVQLDLHVAVSGVAAFLTAGAVFASVRKDGEASRGHGPIAAGLWLGLGALARPVTVLALPFFAWSEWKWTSTRRLARVAMLGGAFAACVIPSLLRNRAASGEWISFTTSSGMNTHIGNNSESRKFRTMASPHTSFRPIEMHEEAREFVIRQPDGKPDPSWSEVSDYFTRMAVREFAAHPGESLVWYLNKARWFFAPVEVPSTASLANDLFFTPVLRIAFVPTWLLAAAAAVGLFLHRRRRDVVCGAGALALAHLAVLTLVFPLSHYRSPAIPALAVLAGGAVHAALVAWRSGTRGITWRIGAGVAVVALAGTIPPQPDPLKHADAMLLAHDATRRRDFAEGIRFAKVALAEFHAVAPDRPELVPALHLIGQLEWARENRAESLLVLGRALEIQPANLRIRLMRSTVAEEVGDLDLAEQDARRAIQDYPDSADAHERLRQVLERRQGR